MIELMDDSLRPVPVGAEGVLCLSRDSHPGLMKEYWNKPESTAHVFRGDWYYSGDVLVCDPDGYFWFRGRNDDVINASGYRISPFEVESCLVSHPAVLEAAAVESPDPVRGMVVEGVRRPQGRPFAWRLARPRNPAACQADDRSVQVSAPDRVCRGLAENSFRQDQARANCASWNEPAPPDDEAQCWSRRAMSQRRRDARPAKLAKLAATSSSCRA